MKHLDPMNLTVVFKASDDFVADGGTRTALDEAQAIESKITVADGGDYSSDPAARILVASAEEGGGVSRGIVLEAA